MTNTAASSLSFAIAQDVPLISASTVTKRLIEIAITAQETAARPARLPLNLALVLDRSGSMDGHKLAYAKRAACTVLDKLNERDQIAVVAFDSEVSLIAPTTPLHTGQRERLQQQINALDTGSSTALFDGWLRGAEEVAAHQVTGGVNRVLLLTDGQANLGLTEPRQLGHHAGQLRQRGIATSTFGIGADFNQFLLETMATQGGGQYQFIENPASMTSYFEAELRELLSVAARNVVLTVSAPSGAALSLLGGFLHERQGGVLTVPIGDLSEGRQLTFCLELLTPTAAPGKEICLDIALTFLDAENRPAQLRGQAVFTYVGESEAKAAPRNMEVRRRAAARQMDAAEANALELSHAGSPEQAAEVMRKAIDKHGPLLPAPAAQSAVELMQELGANTLSVMEQKSRHDRNYRKRHGRI